MGLSTDAIPALVGLYLDPALPKEIRLGLDSPLPCQTTRVKDENQELSWQSFSFSRSQASRILQSLGTGVSDYLVRQDDYGRWWITINGE